jgi:predicted short-subunit dehydrogenase-like oxidoreductase (DUF2520 family)
MKIVIIGSGNVATVLGRRMGQSGHEIMQVFSRNGEHAVSLADELGCPWSAEWTEIRRAEELYLVAISDDALAGLRERLVLPGKVVVHTAGAISRNVLQGVAENYGVLYPLQSLRASIQAIPEIPLLVDGNDPVTLERISDFARTISGQVQAADDENRLKLHLAGVIVNNFGNHLYALTAAFCRQEGIAFDLLLPLIGETAGRLAHTDPWDAQTGPAIRGDRATIGAHLKLLDNYKDIKELYELMTFQIQELHKKA